MKKDYIFVAQILSQSEPKEVKIEIPEGYEIDKEKSTFEKIVFKKKDTKPRSWNAFCKKCPIGNNEYYIHGSDGSIRKSAPGKRDAWADTAVLPSEKLAEAFLAMMQLMSLRQDWIGDWKPDWNDVNQEKAYILGGGNNFTVSHFSKINSRPLSFPTEEMAEDFMNCFKDLLKVAEPLI